MAEAGRSSRFLQPPPRPLRQLVQPVFLTPDLQAPCLLVARRRIAQLGERNPQLRRPAKRIDVRLHFPHGVPRLIAAAAESVRVLLDTGGIHGEEEPADVIVIGIENDFEVVGREVGIPAHEPCAHAARARVVEHPCPDVDGGIIEGETDFRPLRGRLSLVRLILPQPGRDWRRVPHRLVEFAVEMDLLPQLDGGDLRWRSGMNVLRY